MKRLLKSKTGGVVVSIYNGNKVALLTVGINSKILIIGH